MNLAVRPKNVRNMWHGVQVLGRLGYLMRYTKKLAIGEYRGILLRFIAVVHV